MLIGRVGASISVAINHPDNSAFKFLGISLKIQKNCATYNEEYF